MGRIAGRFARVEPRRRAARLVLGLLADLPRKNCWTIAEWAGETTPDGMQHLLGRAKWDADQVRDDVCGYVVEHLHDDRAVLVVDETGDVKKGTGTVGVQRQYTGTAGRIENSQVAVYLVYAGQRGHAAVDRELYVPRSWTSDPDRCRAAGLAEDTTFATKPELATRTVLRFLDAGHQAAWAADDEVYGGNPKLRTALEDPKGDTCCRLPGLPQACTNTVHQTSLLAPMPQSAISPLRIFVQTPLARQCQVPTRENRSW